MSYPEYPSSEPSYPPYPTPQGYGTPEMGGQGSYRISSFEQQQPMYPPGPPGGGFGAPPMVPPSFGFGATPMVPPSVGYGGPPMVPPMGPPGGHYGSYPMEPPGAFGVPPMGPPGGFGPPVFGMPPVIPPQPYPGYPNMHPGMPSNAPPVGHIPMATNAMPIYTDANIHMAHQPSAPGEHHLEEKHELKAPEIHSPEHKDEGTIKPHEPFEPKSDAEKLKKAMKGFGTNEKIIIEILTNRSCSQRVDIVREYKGMFGKDLINSLKKELGGSFESAIVALLKSRSKLLADALHSAMSGAGTKERVLIEVLCTGTNKELHEINEAYREAYGKPVEKDIKGDTSGYLENLLVALSQGTRSESHEVHRDKAAEDAAVLYKAGEKKWGTNESAFTVMLVSKSYAELRCIFEEYEKLAKHSIETAIKKEFSGSLLDAMLAIVKCVRNKVEYFTEQIYGAIKPMGTHDHTLIRLIVSRSEIDLKLIKEEYQKKYKKSLSAAISSDTSGDYKKVLLGIVKA